MRGSLGTHVFQSVVIQASLGTRYVNSWSPNLLSECFTDHLNPILHAYLEPIYTVIDVQIRCAVKC